MTSLTWSWHTKPASQSLSVQHSGSVQVSWGTVHTLQLISVIRGQLASWDLILIYQYLTTKKIISACFIINLTSQHSGSTHCWFSQLLQGVLAQSSSARQKPSGVVVVVGALVVVVVDFVVVMGSVVGTFVGLGVEVVQSTPFGQSHTGPSGN